MVTVVDGLTGSKLLAAGIQRAYELQVRRIAVQPAVLNNLDTLDRDLIKLHGRSESGGSAASACPR